MRHLSLATLALLSAIATHSSAQTSHLADYHTIPLPREINEAGSGEFILTPQNRDHSIRTKIDPDAKRWANDRVKNDAYEIKVDKKGIEITGASEAGVFYGMQTLRKAIHLDEGADNETYTLPYVEIHDSPEFEYRGVHLDCSRHFFPAAFIKKYIDNGLITFDEMKPKIQESYKAHELKYAKKN